LRDYKHYFTFQAQKQHVNLENAGALQTFYIKSQYIHVYMRLFGGDFFFSISGLCMHNVGHTQILYAESGLFYWQGDIDLNTASINPGYDESLAPLLNVQLKYQIASASKLGGSFGRLFFDGQQVDTLGVTVS